MPKGIDLTGQEFGYWKVIERIPRIPGQKGSIRWKCLCTKCNEIYEVLGDSLRKGTSTQCVKCSQKDKIINMAGQTVNNVYVFEQIKSDKKEAHWRCQCPKCKREDWIVRGSHLRAGITMCEKCASLENLKKIKKPFFKDLTNKRFGKLIAIRPTKERLDTSVIWECNCDCGRTCYKASCYLINSDTSSCGKCSFRSKGELKITKLLDDNAITYEAEKSITIDGHRYRFDFYIPNLNYYIEYDGEQHFKDNEWESIEEIQKRDNIKNQWCKENDISLIRIPYTRYKELTIEDLLLDSSNFIVI